MNLFLKKSVFVLCIATITSTIMIADQNDKWYQEQFEQDWSEYQTKLKNDPQATFDLDKYVHWNRPEIVEHACKCGVGQKEKDDALRYASLRDDLSTLNILIAGGANLNNSYALHVAKSKEAIRLLLKNQADINKQWDEETPLEYQISSYYSKVEPVAELLNQGAKLHFKDVTKNADVTQSNEYKEISSRVKSCIERMQENPKYVDHCAEVKKMKEAFEQFQTNKELQEKRIEKLENFFENYYGND